MKADLSPRTKPESTTDRPTSTESAHRTIPLDVFPYHVGESDANDGADSRPVPRLPRRGGGVRSTDCPACGGSTINGAGLFACTECPWSGAIR